MTINYHYNRFIAGGSQQNSKDTMDTFDMQ